ncbi:3D domain-containing protein [Carnobacterium divergens]|uniref:3D domain-containing protein n=1 Tax=Carnobacterium divergens TaxID=2748 RepID=UPI00128B9892|nr:3D domain-containing protein [Carnobacterium divergens]MPQ23110.1 LysM peptidoglycan-binding domain-containing protein [Carnobacterium divergens]
MNFKKTVVTTVAALSLAVTGLYVTADQADAAELPNGNWQIEKNDTLSHVSEKTGVSVQTLITNNNNINPLTLQIGSELIINGGSLTSAPVVATPSVEAAAPAATVAQAPAPVTTGVAAGTFNASYYTAFDGSQSGVTANGTDVRGGQTTTADGYRIIAADPSVLPLNTIVSITTSNGESFMAKVCDTGGAIKGNKIDILVGSPSEALSLGRSVATISIVK